MLQGVIPALMTPFGANGTQVDLVALRKLCDHLIASKVAGLFVTGTTGEFVSLNPDERRLVIREAIKYVNGRIPVLIHVGSFNTAETVALTKYAKELGADGIGAMPPYFYRLDEEALFAHFARVAEAAAGMPMFLYNIPGAALNEISLANVARLKKAFPHIRGIKDSSGDMERERKMVEMNMPDFIVINGCDEETLTALKHGVRATVSSTANVFPEAFTAVYEPFLAGDMKKAQAAQDRLFKLTQILDHGRTLGAYKQALAWKGVDIGPVRPPLRELTDNERAELRAELEKAQWI